MAELEVSKSLNKVVSIAKEKDKNTKHKVKEIVGEVLIIVFAVSLSIYLHSWSEDHHDQKNVEIFMSGLKNDLQNDINEMQIDLKAFQNQKKMYQYIAALGDGDTAHKDSIDLYKPYLFSYTGLGKSNGRYEGFKSSGRLDNIENDVLENLVLDYYEELIPQIKNSTDYFKTQKTKMADYVVEQTVGYPDGNFVEVFSSSVVKNRCRIYLTNLDQIIHQYQRGLNAANEIVHQIDVDYEH